MMPGVRHLVCLGAAVAAAACAAAPAAGAAILPPRPLLPAVAARSGGRCADVSDALSQLRWQPGPAGFRARYLLAHCLLARGETEAAAAEFNAVAAAYPPLADHARWYAAQAALQSADLSGAAERLVFLSGSTRIPPLARRARVAAAEVLLQLNRPEDALRALAPVSADGSGPASVRVWWLRGRAAEMAGRRADAVRAYAVAWWSEPEATPEGDAARARLEALGLGGVAPPVEARLTRARRLVGLGEFDAAQRELVAALHQGLAGPQAADAWFQLGLLRLPGDGAVFAFSQAARVADPAARARALYWLGRALSARARREEARAVWMRVVREFAGTAWGPRALASVAFAAEAADDLAQARRWWAELVRRYPASAPAADARWRLGWIAFRQGRYREAERLFRDHAAHLAGSPQAAAGLFWAGKARRAAGGQPHDLWRVVAERYPFTYYGQRARQILGLPAPPPPAAGAPVHLPEDSPAPAYQELAALGFVEDALEAVQAPSEGRAVPEQARELAAAESWLRSVAGDPSGALAAAASLLPAALAGDPAVDRDLWSVMYPRAFWDEVRSAARRHRVDPYLVLAVMREESRFDPRAVSPARAVGLMQVIPATAQATAGRPVEVAQLMDPAVNIDLGAAYLAAMVRRFGGDLVLALSAYNAGPAAAGRWSRMPRSDPDLAVESIPFAETRAYVRRVIQSYGIYRWLYP